MKVNISLEQVIPTKKLETTKQLAKKDDFKKVLDNHEESSRNASNNNVSKSKNKELDDVNKKTTIESNGPKKVGNEEKPNDLNSKEDSSLGTLTKELQKISEAIAKEVTSQEEPTDEMLQIQQLLQSMILLLQKPSDDTQAKVKGNEGTVIIPEQLLELEKPASSSKDIISTKIGEIVAMLEKSKVNTGVNSQIIEMLQKVTSEEMQGKTDVNLIKTSIVQVMSLSNDDKSVTDSSLKNLMKNSSDVVYDVSSKNQMQNPGDTSKDNKSSSNSSFEEKFLANFFTEDKDDMKISKAINFMNQFESVKTMDASKVETPNVVIDKSSLGADVIKTIKFMEINNVKDLTVKMNPKELGEITIKIIVESGVMKASLTAQNKETYNLLNQNMQDITDKLKSMDIKIQSLDINIYEDSTFFNKNSNSQNEKNNNQGESNNSKSTISSEEDIEITNNAATEQNQVNKFV